MRRDAITDAAPPGGALLKTLHEGGDGFIQGQFPETDVKQLQTLMENFDAAFELAYKNSQRQHFCSTEHKGISNIDDKCETCLADALVQLSFNAVCNNDSDSKGSDVAMADGTPNPLTHFVCIVLLCLLLLTPTLTIMAGACRSAKVAKGRLPVTHRRQQSNSTGTRMVRW